MKQFKGGLYANLGNYKSSLPQTKILNDFFNQNPVGYKKGGEVKGIKGVNYSRIPVTGGFMANAQGFQTGGDVARSSFYSPSNVGVRPGAFRAQGNQRRLNIIQGINDLYGGNTYRIGIAKKNRNNDYQRIANMLKVDVKDVEDAFADFSDPIETFDVEKAVKGKKGESIKDVQDKPAQITQLTEAPTALEQMEGDIPDQTAFMSKPQEVKKEPFVSQNPQYIKQMIDAGITTLGETTTPAITAYKKKHKEDLGFIDPDEVLNKQKEDKKKIKDTGTDDTDTGTITETKGSGISQISVDKPDDAKGPGEIKSKSIFDKMKEEGLDKKTDQETVFNEIFNKSGLDKLYDNYTAANEADIKALNEIGKEFYDKDGKDAPAWAMPLMMAGLQMAASNNPDMLGALGEGGVAGLQEYARQQQEKKQDAKDKIALDMQKLDKTLAIKQRGLDLEKDIALIKNDALMKAFEISETQNMDVDRALRDAIIRDADRELNEFEINERLKIQYLEFDKDYDFKNADLEVEYMRLLADKEAREDDKAYKEQLLKLEILKSNNDWQKHLNLVKLEQVDKGKTTTIFMPDENGNMKEFKVQVHYNFETGKFDKTILGYAPPDQDELDGLYDDIVSRFEFDEAFQALDPSEQLDRIEEELQKLVNQKYGDIDAALDDTDSQITETSPGG